LDFIDELNGGEDSILGDVPDGGYDLASAGFEDDALNNSLSEEGLEANDNGLILEEYSEPEQQNYQEETEILEK